MKDLLTNRDIDSGKKNLWIVLFIYLSIFINSYVFFTNPFEFYLGYLIYLALLPVFLFRYQLNRNMVAIFLILFLTGIFNILIGNNTSALFFKVFTGLVLSYFFYYFVILEFDYNIEQLFIWYLRGCYIIALIGIVQFVSFQVGFTPGYNFKWIFNKWGFIPGGLFGIRVNSVFAEPTYLASTFSPLPQRTVWHLALQKRSDRIGLPHVFLRAGTNRHLSRPDPDVSQLRPDPLRDCHCAHHLHLV
jgi:hypothetical protein